jgi:hypothetical protein
MTTEELKALYPELYAEVLNVEAEAKGKTLSQKEQAQANIKLIKLIRNFTPENIKHAKIEAFRKEVRAVLNLK